MASTSPLLPMQNPVLKLARHAQPLTVVKGYLLPAEVLALATKQE